MHSLLIRAAAHGGERCLGGKIRVYVELRHLRYETFIMVLVKLGLVDVVGYFSDAL